MTTTPALTDNQKALIAARRRVIRVELHGRFNNWAYNRVREDNRNTVGGQMDNRQVGFAKVALFNEGRYLLSHWTDIRAELDMDPLAHAYRMRRVRGGVRGTMLMAWAQATLESRFYQTVKTGDAVDAFGGWSASRVDAIPDFGAVTRDDVWEWLGYMGGTA